jgi:uncharacterized protein YjgD (DUF1641 family)
VDSGSDGVALLREKLDDPHVSETIARLLDRIDALESAVVRLTDVVEQAPAVVETVTNVADDTVRRAAQRGVDVDERVRASLLLLERLSDPQMVAALNHLMDLARDSEGILATMGDMFDEAARGLDLDARARSGTALLERATRVDTVDQLGEMFDTLLDAEDGMLSPSAVDTLGVAAQALVAARQAPARRATLWQAFRAARDPGLQRALGFLLEFGEQFAGRLDR